MGFSQTVEIGFRLRHLRDLRGNENGPMSRREFAAKIGLSYASIKLYEAGGGKPGKRALELFSAAGYNTDWILYEIGDPHKFLTYSPHIR